MAALRRSTPARSRSPPPALRRATQARYREWTRAQSPWGRRAPRCATPARRGPTPAPDATLGVAPPVHVTVHLRPDLGSRGPGDGYRNGFGFGSVDGFVDGYRYGNANGYAAGPQPCLYP